MNVVFLTWLSDLFEGVEGPGTMFCKAGIEVYNQCISVLTGILLSDLNSSSGSAATFSDAWNSIIAVSYTHLDVYKRQADKGRRDR